MRALSSSLFTTMLLLLLCQPLVAAKQDPLMRLAAMPNASLVLEVQGKRVASKEADRQMVPASTLKLVIALAALEHWGGAYRFETRFYRQGDVLWIRGGGDPFLVSEELDLMVAALRNKNVMRLSAIYTDASLFAADLEIDGRSQTHNPYDAPVSALAANFNTVSYQRSGGKIISAEAQTPMTALGRQVAQGFVNSRRKGRVNLLSQSNGPRYFVELLAAKLRRAGVTVADNFSAQAVPHKLKPFYIHKNSHDLKQVVAAMLEHSSNFIANSLFLMMADDSGPLTMKKAQQHMQQWIKKRFQWQEFALLEGAGLSRNNRLSAMQLLDVVKAFAPYRDLLPNYQQTIMAKTGTLSGVSCFAGFILRDGDWQPFSLMINQPSDYSFRVEVAQALATHPLLPSALCGKDC